MIAPNLSEDSVAAQREIPELLSKNAGVNQKLNGVNLSEFQERHNFEKSVFGDAKVTKNLNDVISTTSKADLANTNVGVDNKGKLSVDTNGDLGKSLRLDPQSLPDGVDGTKLSSVSGMDISQGSLNNLGRYADIVGKAGFVGDVLGIGLALGESTIALANGEPQQAGKILAEATAEVAGGFAVGTAAAAVVGGALLAAGAPVAAVAGALGAGLYFGYKGGSAAGELAKEIYDDIARMGVVPYAKDILNDYGWALANPGAILGELPPWLQDVLGPLGDVLGIRPPSGTGGGGDPLVLDLDRDGDIELTTLQDGAHFDLWSDGHAKKMGWVSADDGLLAYDKNGDGFIDGVNELFGSGEPLTFADASSDVFFGDGANGFSILDDYDSNDDGEINALDDVWSRREARSVTKRMRQLKREVANDNFMFTPSLIVAH